MFVIIYLIDSKILKENRVIFWEQDTKYTNHVTWHVLFSDIVNSLPMLRTWHVVGYRIMRKSPCCLLLDTSRETRLARYSSEGASVPGPVRLIVELEFAPLRE